MKITNITPFVVDAGWRNWILVKVETDAGISGWGECSDRAVHGVVGTMRDLAAVVVGQDPLAYEARWWDMYRALQASPGGIGAKAIAGIELALIDIAARARDCSVAELFGGPLRDRVRVYWSHCGTSRIRAHELIGTPPLRSMDDVAALGREVVAKGFTALKTNILFPGDPGAVYLPMREAGGAADQVASNALIDHIVTLMGTFRDAVSSAPRPQSGSGAGSEPRPEVDLLLDLNFNFKPESCLEIARALEPLHLLWLEIDLYEPEALAEVRRKTSTRLCTGETLYYERAFLPYLQARSADFLMIDIPWNGFGPSKRMGELAQTFQVNVAPHNYYSHLSSFISASLCAVLPNVRIMEIDIDDVPWKDAMVTNLPEIVDGYMMVPSGVGWGVEIVEEALLEHQVGAFTNSSSG